MATEDEAKALAAKLELERRGYEQLSDFVVERCLEFKDSLPTVVRVVFSRVPKLKTVDSILGKIAKKQSSSPGYSFEDLTDIVALTVLCPYRSDVDVFCAWLTSVFPIVEKDFTEHDSGHRAWHFVIEAPKEAVMMNGRLLGKRCEVQVKTLLEEAFDAKGHDLVYKSGPRQISESLKKQFGVLGASLHALDEQSEFLKDLIVEEEKEVTLRRLACVMLFLIEPETPKIAKRLKIDIDALPTLSLNKIGEALAKALDVKKALSPDKVFAICEFAAFCALKRNNDYLIRTALKLAERLVTSPPTCVGYYRRGLIKWTLGDIHGALADTDQAINLASTAPKRAKYMNNFVYFAADDACRDGVSTPAHRNRAMDLAIALVSGDVSNSYRDTFGLHCIAHGEEWHSVRWGLDFVRAAKEARGGDPLAEHFCRYHEYVGLRKLLRLSA